MKCHICGTDNNISSCLHYNKQKSLAIFIRTGETTESILNILNKYSTKKAKCIQEIRDFLTIEVNPNLDWEAICAKEGISYFGKQSA